MTKDIKETKIEVKTLELKTDKSDKTVEATDTISEVAKELLALRKELESLKKEKKSFSDAEKAAIEEAREDMLTDDEVGQLYIDEKYKEEGYSYRIVDSTRPGRVQQMIKKGYEIVEDSSMSIGQNIAGRSSTLASAVTVELGIHKGSCLGVLMRIPKDQYDKRQTAKVRKNRELNEAMMQNMVDKSDFGTITIGESLYKK